jgi:hypothetical protein
MNKVFRSLSKLLRKIEIQKYRNERANRMMDCTANASEKH